MFSYVQAIYSASFDLRDGTDRQSDVRQTYCMTICYSALIIPDQLTAEQNMSSHFYLFILLLQGKKRTFLNVLRTHTKINLSTNKKKRQEEGKQ